MLLPRPTDWQIRGTQRLWSTGGKRSDFDAAAQKKVHILEARDRVLARLRDKKRDAAEAAKFKKKEKKTGKGGAEGKATKPKDSKKSKSTSTDERSTAAVAAGGVEVVGDGAPAERKRRVRQAAVVATMEPVEHEEEDEAQELPPPMTLDDVVQVLREEKGLNPMVIDVSQKCNFTHYMIIIEGRSGRHLRAMAERIMDEMQARQKHPQANVGLEVDRGNDDWIVVDTGDILVQLFSPGARRYYDLEGLWTLQKRMSERDGQNEVVDVEDLEPLPDLDDVPNAWNPWDQDVQKA